MSSLLFPSATGIDAPPPAASAAAARWRRALHATFASEAHFAPTVARVVLGAVLLPHGAQKLLGWFGGYGFAGTMQWFTDTMHIPWILGLAAIVTETVGALALVAGVASRIAALATGAVFATATLLVHWPHGFFANWFGQQQGEGFEYFILGLGLALIVAVHGGGAASIDRLLARRLAR